ncbi:MAG TPA: DUF1249 domain-containing protein [Steroidobacteraceae bacterium]|jgi:hypothetical protein|nr:DUF1249 domain-containing protein [Steroidobacteraceae bacterium]
MFCDADIRVSWRARPRSFVALMSLYESNHVRFLQLAGDPARLCGTLISRVEGDCELQLAVLGHMPYTSMLTLTYLLPAAAAAGPYCERLPDLKLRAYHDARLLEVEDSYPVRAPRARAGRPPGERELQQRWMRNMMLNKWLEYCVERGHRFTRHRILD